MSFPTHPSNPHPIPNPLSTWIESLNEAQIGANIFETLGASRLTHAEVRSHKERHPMVGRVVPVTRRMRGGGISVQVKGRGVRAKEEFHEYINVLRWNQNYTYGEVLLEQSQVAEENDALRAYVAAHAECVFTLFDADPASRKSAYLSMPGRFAREDCVRGKQHFVIVLHIRRRAAPPGAPLRVGGGGWQNRSCRTLPPASANALTGIVGNKKVVQLSLHESVALKKKISGKRKRQ